MKDSLFLYLSHKAHFTRTGLSGTMADIWPTIMVHIVHICIKIKLLSYFGFTSMPPGSGLAESGVICLLFAFAFHCGGKMLTAINICKCHPDWWHGVYRLMAVYVGTCLQSYFSRYDNMFPFYIPAHYFHRSTSFQAQSRSVTKIYPFWYICCSDSPLVSVNCQSYYFYLKKTQPWAGCTCQNVTVFPLRKAP